MPRVRSPEVGSGSDEYDSFDEEELELLNDLLQSYSLPRQPATRDYPEKICYPSLNITGQSDSEGQFDDAEEEPNLPRVEAKPNLSHVGAGGDDFQVPELQTETVTDNLCEVQYTGIVKSVPAGIF